MSQLETFVHRPPGCGAGCVVGAEGKAIVAAVAARHGLKVAELLSHDRTHRVAHPRQEAMFELYATGRYSTTTIGAFLGGRDHTTVLHGVQAHTARLAKAEAAAA